MRGKTFLILLVVAGVLVALVFYRFGDKTPAGKTTMGATLFSDLPVNQVASVFIADAEHTVTLVKGDTVWQVEERDGYPADFDALRDTVVKLSRLKVGRSFAGSPESLKRLSLMAPTTAEETGRGMQITLKDSSEKHLADVILGQDRETDGGGSGGQYLKKSDDDTVFLVDGSFRFLKSEPAEWLRKEILDIKADAVASVTCYADEKQTPAYTLSRPKKGEAPQMNPVPPGRSVDPAKVDQVFDALAPLSLDDVAAVGGHPEITEAGHTRLIFRLYDGRQITIFPETAGEARYTLRVTAASVADASETRDADEPTSENGVSDKAEAAKPDAEAVSAVKTAEQLNQELRPWIFSVKKWQFDSFVTQPDALLEAVKKEGDGAS